MKIRSVFFLLICLFARSFLLGLQIDDSYTETVQKILFYKEDKFSVFYGGPIDNINRGVQWMMPCKFEDDSYKTRAVYEIAFVNCNLSNCKDAEILFINVSDINIKFQNRLTSDYRVFIDLMNGNYSKNKYVVVRAADVANVFYPENFIYSHYGKYEELDKKVIAKFLSQNFSTQNHIRDFYLGVNKEEVDYENELEISYKPIKLEIAFDQDVKSFYLLKKIVKKDDWKLYYLLSKELITSVVSVNENLLPLVRIDSGCVSGQIYDDRSCDCLDQLLVGMLQISEENSEFSILIHVPAHDGRGYGTAPKAETEIYKRGGKGRVYTTGPLDTVQSAKLLYASGLYDIRTYEGSAVILKEMGFTKVSLLTDNAKKVACLNRHGIEVVRRKTETNKESCLEHIHAKKNTETYYND